MRSTVYRDMDYRNELPHWISAKFSSFGMEVSAQNFTVSLPVMLDDQVCLCYSVCDAIVI